MAREPDTIWLCGLEYVLEPQDYVLQYSGECVNENSGLRWAEPLTFLYKKKRKSRSIRKKIEANCIVFHFGSPMFGVLMSASRQSKLCTILTCGECLTAKCVGFGRQGLRPAYSRKGHI